MVLMRATVRLAPLVGVALAVFVYRDVYAAEDGRYAGAEPALAGLFVTAPFLVMVVAQASCAVGAHVAATARNRTAWVGAALILTALGLLGALRII